MTTNLITVSPDTFLARVTKIFDENNFHHLPVVKENNELVGIISKEDFQKMSLFFFEKKSGEVKSEGLRASDIMTAYPISLDPDDSIGLAADIFLANRFHSLPVIEDNTLIGLVTSHDLITYAFKSELEEKADYEFIER